MNQLKRAKSPYLLQHKDNPVDWRQWSPETLETARRENKPILLSSGYSACHWCHVMAHESFEDLKTAEIMNRHFINIKLDREERPDLDHIYQMALALTGEPGGWPLTMFLTPDGKPFFGGTYFPPEPKYGRPGFGQVLEGIAGSWQNERDVIDYNVEALMSGLKRESSAKSGNLPDTAVLDRAMGKLISGFDPKYGGFGGAPKFPQVPLLSFLWQYSESGTANPDGASPTTHLRSDNDIYRKAALVTLDNICQGGIFDHIGGGFFRYAVDQYWLVPHFEKMLYDNALLLRLLTRAFQGSNSRLYKARIYETVGWLLRDMQVAGRESFAAAISADSEGVEGKFYIWDKAEIDAVLNSDAAEFNGIYDVRDTGNWEGKTVLNRLRHQGLFNDKKEARLAEMKAKLKHVRDERVHPDRDTKILTDWNAMLAVALIEAGQCFNEESWVARGGRIFNELKHNIVHCRINGAVTAEALLDDYAWMTLAALKLFEARGDDAYLKAAQTLYAEIKKRFSDEENGGFFMSDKNHDDVIINAKTINDTAIPSGNAVMVEVLAALAGQSGDPIYRWDCKALIESFAGEIEAAPYAMGGYLAGVLNALNKDLNKEQNKILS